MTSLDAKQAIGRINYPPNVRPETCPRSKLGEYAGLESLRSSTLILGDGDFSFSLSIARSDPPRAKKYLVTSSYESKDTLLRIYSTAGHNIATLEDMGVQVLFNVDATNLSQCSVLENKVFRSIVWNFPCVCADHGADGQATELAQNQALVSGFFRNLSAFLHPRKGEVHVTHKTIEPFSWWGLKDLAQQQGFRCAFEVVFDKYNYPGYTNRKALDKKSFTCNDARTFVFVPASSDPEKVLQGHATKLMLVDEEALAATVARIWGSSNASCKRFRDDFSAGTDDRKRKMDRSGSRKL
eukprot:gene33989-41132_t